MEQQFSSFSSSASSDDSPALTPGFGRRSFTVGAALGQGFGTFFKNLPAFLLIGLVIYAPLFAYGLTRDTASMTIEELGRAWVYIFYGAYVVGWLVTAALTFGVLEQMSGRRASIGRCLLVGLRTMIPAILLMIAIVVIGFILTFLAILLVSLLFAMTPVLGVIGLIAVAFAVLAFYMAFYVAVPALAIERRGVIESLSRSSDLTRGRRWQVFAVWLVTAVAGVGLAWLLGRVLTGSGGIDATSWRTVLVVNLSVQTLTSVLGGTVCATVYVLLRKDADGTDVGELAKVFD
jgi:hypothetical protein